MAKKKTTKRKSVSTKNATKAPAKKAAPKTKPAKKVAKPAKRAKPAKPAKSSPPVDNSPSPMIAALEQQLLQQPDDAATWQVYADALQQRSDPRGDVIVLGERLRAGETKLAAQYAERCRAARWPRGAPFPRMSYRVRFEQLIAELKAHPGVTVKKAEIADARPDDLARWQAVAGPAWPEGMTELYSEVSSVEIEYTVNGFESVNGAISIPTLDLWDYERLEGHLWFDFSEPESALHRIRPIDCFVPEAYTVLYLRDKKSPAEVAYHYCGESLVPVGLTYREWAELLFRARGVLYWIQLAIGPTKDRTWVGEGIDQVAKMFPDFDPTTMSPKRSFKEVPL
ncbi:MAG: hypothetical protein M4D80_09940 [Myxococcota bacterium]|nr:hypothetical protein [Myxococcota bacterium]